MMETINLVNEEAISLLNECLWFTEPHVTDCVRPLKLDWKKEREYWLSEKIKNRCIDDFTKHEGFPDQCVGWGFQHNTVKYITKDERLAEQIAQKYNDINEKMRTKFMFKTTALFTVYPPGGFIGWHNNANASAYNFIFTWSETGDGWFKYANPVDRKTITIHDTPGWQCKAGYFGSYSDPPEKLCYHAASADCMRMTVAFVLDRSDLSLGFQKEIKEELESYK